MNNVNLSTIINHHVYDFDEVSGIHWESEQEPFDTAIIEFTNTHLRARVTEDAENHVLLFSIFRWTESDDPTHTDGCVEYPEALDSIDAPESVLQQTARNLFGKIWETVHQHEQNLA